VLFDQPELFRRITEFVESPDAHHLNVFGAAVRGEVRRILVA
jgi:hypothetical protein